MPDSFSSGYASSRPANVQRKAEQYGERRDRGNAAFDRVNAYQSRLNQQRGNGPMGEMRSPQNNREMVFAKLLQQRVGGFQPINVGRSPGGLDLVGFGGKQIARSVLPFAQQLAGMGLRFASGYRDPVHNARVNGVKNSYHLQGRALDFSGSAKAMQAGAAWARKNGAREVLIHNAGSGTHLHVAW